MQNSNLSLLTIKTENTLLLTNFVQKFILCISSEKFKAFYFVLLPIYIIIGRKFVKEPIFWQH